MGYRLPRFYIPDEPVCYADVLRELYVRGHEWGTQADFSEWLVRARKKSSIDSRLSQKVVVFTECFSGKFKMYDMSIGKYGEVEENAEIWPENYAFLFIRIEENNEK